MKKKLLVLLPAMFALAACGTQQASSSQQQSSSAEQTSASLSLKGYSLSKDRDSVTGSSYDLKTVITLETLSSITDLTFASSNEEVATVNAQGVITRVGYGNASITIAVASEPTSLWKVSTFNIFFTPDQSLLLGKYDNHMDAPEGKTQVLVTLELKQNNAFTLSYTAGTILDYDQEYTISALEAEGTYTVDSLYYFTVSTASFPYKKTFSGQMIYDGDKATLKLKVPVAEEKTSRICYFEKVNQ